MAVLPSLPGIEVTVCVNKVPLKEYFDDEPSENPGRHRDSLAPRIVSKYIEAITDQEFTLHFRVVKPYDVDSPSLVFSTSVDGKNISSTLFRLSKHESITPLEKDTLGVKSYNSETGKSTFQALKFSRISTTVDDDKLASVKEDSKRLSKIGMIIVKLYRESEARLVPRKSWSTNFGSGDASEVHEKALKGQAKSHGVSLGPAKARNASSEVWATSRLDGQDSPIAKFIFHYRSMESLKQLYIIERTPEPGPSIPSQEPTSTSNTSPKVKRELADNDGSFVPKKRAKSLGTKTMIDLTSDSENENEETTSFH